MKKVMVLISLLFLSGCSNNNGSNVIVEQVNDNQFLEIRSDDTITENTYYLDLNLDDENRSLGVVGKLFYIVSEETNTLHIKLYPNAESLFDSSYLIDMEYLKVNGTVVEFAFSGVDKTTIEVQLDEKVNKDSIIEVDFSYSFEYWEDKGRMTHYDNLYVTMFFYPFIIQNEDQPLSTYDYAYNGESYFNTIGDYYVSINVPRKVKVASSGKEIDVKKGLIRTTYNYFLDDGRDFSFSASEDYTIYTADHDTIDFTIYSKRKLSDQEVIDTFATLKNAFSVYEEYIGEYPYDYFTLELGYIYGMESTGIVYCNDEISMYTIVHEIIHQWFYSIIHNDQASEPFLDEALTTYTTFIYLYETYGEEEATEYLDYRSSMKEGLVTSFDLYQGESLLNSVHDYQTGYGYIIYYHGPTIWRYYFEEIAGGDLDVLKGFLHAYYNEFKFKEVNTLEMLDLLERTTGIAGTTEWFLEELEYLDYIESLE